MTEDERAGPVIIHILGNDQRVTGGIERYKDFHCFGRQNAEKVCSRCTLRFICFTETNQIEVSCRFFGKYSMTEITAATVAEICTPDLDYKERKDKDNHIKIVLDFEREKGDDNGST